MGKLHERLISSCLVVFVAYALSHGNLCFAHGYDELTTTTETPTLPPFWYSTSPASSSSLWVNASAVCDFENWRKFANCSHRNLTAVPLNFPVDTEILYLSVNLIFRLRNDSLSNLTRLTELRLDYCAINTIESGALDALGNLELLDLSGNSLSEIPVGIFAQTPNLRELNLGNNLFSWIPCGALLPLTRLESVLLFLNGIKYPYCETFPTLANDSVFSLSRNSIRTLFTWTLSFLENSTLRSLALRGNDLTTLSYKVVANLNVRSLDLSYNPLNPLAIASVFYGANLNDILTSLILRSASLNDATDPVIYKFIENKTLEYMDLSSNQFYSVPPGLRYLKHLLNLSLADNRIEILNPQNFSTMRDLEGLSLENNDIVELLSLSDDFRWKISSLRNLNLARNRLEEIPSKAFFGLDGLSILDMHSNPIRYTNVEALYGLDQLTVLDLSGTLLSNLPDGTLRFVSNLKSLSYRNANMKGNPGHFLDHLSKLEFIDLSGNDLQADNIWDAELELSLFAGTHMLREILLDGNEQIGEIPFKVFSNLTALTTLSLSNCGIRTLDSRLFKDLRNLTSLFLDNNVISELHPRTFMNLRMLQVMSAAGNALTDLDSRVFQNSKSLEHIALPNNAITVISGDTFHALPNLKSLDVQGNPFGCTCALKSFADWLKVTDAFFLIGAKHTLCSPASFKDVVNQPIAAFNTGAYCGPNIALYVSVSLLIVAVLALMGLGYRFRFWIRYKLFMLKMYFVGFKALEDRGADAHEYYLHVMYAAEDEAWVEEHLRPVIREKLPQKNEHTDMVFGDDDLIPGMYYLEAVDYAVVNSYKTVILLSNAAIRSEWFTTKFRVAVRHVNEAQLQKVILVFIEEIEDRNLPYVVRVFLSKNLPHLRWTEDDEQQQYFWEKFLKSLEVDIRCDMTIHV